MNGQRIIVEYAGQPTAEQDGRIDRVAATFGMEPGDTGYSFSDRVRDHSIGVPEGADAELLAAEMRSLLPTMKVSVYTPDWDA